MQTSNDTPTSKALTMLFSALALVALFTLCSIVPDALQAAIH
ncbi:hypothetical protein [Ectopseudomonas guguanensis]|jgi:hypothetical protein|nr:hypothetical protein [Pseudomonas guguanensis]MDR8014078.1 hypothetical protein [Pseudomonas guguanensis]